MKTQNLLIPFVLLLMLNCQNNDENCKMFHEGEFVTFRTKENKFDYTTKTIRTKNKQIYCDPINGDTAIYDITWLSSCNCELTFVESNKTVKAPIIPIGSKLIVQMEVLEDSVAIEEWINVSNKSKKLHTLKLRKIK